MNRGPGQVYEAANKSGVGKQTNIMSTVACNSQRNRLIDVLCASATTSKLSMHPIGAPTVV